MGNSISRIGFMQGRLSPQVGGLIQAFPWQHWQDEFIHAARGTFTLMEWTIDKDRMDENPLVTALGRQQILALSKRFNVQIPSITADCFMQSPFWKAIGVDRNEGELVFSRLARLCGAVGIGLMVLPLVDNGRLENLEQENRLVEFLESQEDLLCSCGVRIAFECDYEPTMLQRFIARLSPRAFGINYDVGNSASLGFSPNEEFSAYGARVLNVHIKDRLLGGSTVPLGSGSANFGAVFFELSKVGYSGNFILQTARAPADNHFEVLCHYRDMTVNWMVEYGV